jgi:hypothetical protein
MAFWSSFGVDPGLFFGARDSPRWALVYVAFDRREAHVEGAGRLRLGHPASHGGDYLASEIF